MSSINRREILRIAASAGPFTASSLVRKAAKASPNEQVQIAVLGCGRGVNLAAWFAKLPESQVVAICDPNADRAAELCQRVGEISGKVPPHVVDFRRLLDDASVDALAVATPDHWHVDSTTALSGSTFAPTNWN